MVRWNLVWGSIALPLKTRQNVVQEVKAFLKKSKSSRRHLERVQGLLFASIVNPVMKTRLKDLNRVWRNLARVGQWDRVLRIP